MLPAKFKISFLMVSLCFVPWLMFLPSCAHLFDKPGPKTTVCISDGEKYFDCTANDGEEYQRTIEGTKGHLLFSPADMGEILQDCKLGR